jgi:general secretion pathway protein D
MIKSWKYCVITAIIFLTGCDLMEHRRYHDPSLKLQKEDYENLKTPPLRQKALPSFFPKPQSPSKEPSLSPEMRKKVSLTVSENVPLKTVLIELGRQTGVGMALSPQINFQKVGISYSAYHTPFIHVIKDICVLTDHRFQIQCNRILIEPDDPYLVTYNIQFLNHTRKSENKISVSTNVFSPIDNKNGTENGSDSTLLGHTHMDFWTELGQNLKMILNPGTAASSKSPQPYTLHKQAGLIMIFGTAQQHEQIGNYLKKLKEAASAQVIIEAKIVEVTLDKEFKSGINWRQLGGAVHLTAPLGAFPAHDVVSFSVEHEQFSSVLNLVKKFGTVRTLSNPRLTVMNNQPAMLKVATNEVFFHLEFDRYFQADGKPDVENISSDPLTVPIGLVMIVQPSINLQTGEITMTLRPTISRVQKEVEDPAVSIKSHQKVKSTVPVVQVRELDSVLKLKSGQVLVMGGLMEDRSSHTTAEIPLLDTIPFFGEFAKGKDDDQKLTELVIFLTAHIVEDPYIAEADERIYNSFTEDPRPLQF